jgi:hypothetical protein
MKKGQGLPLSVVVLAAIALIVLIVLILIFNGKIGGFNEGVSSCSSKGGQCLDGNAQIANGGCVEGVYVPNTNCDKEEGSGQVCCVSL